jgi:hypothetical protein
MEGNGICIMAALIQWLVWRSMILQRNELDLFDAGLFEQG